MKNPVQKINEEVLAFVRRLGGDYIWEDEIFSVALQDVPLTDEQVEPLTSLRGVQQIELDARALSAVAIERIARIPGLESLVLNSPSLTSVELARLQTFGPEIEIAGTDDE